MMVTYTYEELKRVAKQAKKTLLKNEWVLVEKSIRKRPRSS